MSDFPPELGDAVPVQEINYTSATPNRSFLGPVEIVSIVTVLAITFVSLCCIGACALLGFAFFQNPPW